MTKKRIVLCADDYGQAEEISHAIIKLIEKNRLSATSCIVNTPWWPQHASWLKSFQSQIDIGLHFNLTEGQALSSAFLKQYGDNFLGFKNLISKAFCHQLNRQTIAAECRAQLDCFINNLGFYPRFIDGHQHVHQFPIIRDALIEVYQARLQQHASFIRLARPKIKITDIIHNVKKILIYAMGSKQLQFLLKKYAIPFNHSFSGIYTFNQSNNYAALFSLFLQEVDDRGLIMCHPAIATNMSDRITFARYDEYQYLASDQFPHDCLAQNVLIQQFA